MKKDQGSDSLFRLVRSLEANEKGYVKKFLKRHSEEGNVNLDLVEALEKQKEYNETLLKKKFKNLAVVKVQAWNEVMDALRIYHKGKSYGFKRSAVIEQVTILQDKGLRKDAEKIILKEIEKGYEIEDFYGLIAFLTIQDVQVDKYPPTQEKIAEAVDNGMSEIISVLDKFKEFWVYYRESTRLYYLQLNSPKEIYTTAIRSFKENSILFQKGKPLSNLAQRYYHEANAIYYGAVGNKKLHIEHLEMYCQKVLERNQKTNANDISIVQSNKLLLEAYFKYQYYDIAQQRINFLYQLEIAHKGVKMFLDRELLFSQLSLYNHTRQLNKLQVFLDKNFNLLISSTQSPRAFTSVSYFRIEYLISLLLLEKHTDALRWILECDNDKTFRTGDTNYQLVLVIEIMLNYVLGDWETAQKEAKKHVKQKEYQFLPLFQALAISDKRKREDTLVKTMSEIQKAEAKSKSLKSFLLMEYFEVFDWIRSVLK